MPQPASLQKLSDNLERIAFALERLATSQDKNQPASTNNAHQAPNMDWHKAQSYIWQAQNCSFQSVDNGIYLNLDRFIAIDQQKERLLHNTKRFAKKLLANNALLWGVRGMGKSSLIKSVFYHLAKDYAHLKLIEIHYAELHSLTELLAQIRNNNFQFILFCDDLSFGYDDQGYKALKSIMEGGLAGQPDNVLIYASSNRRHLLPRDMLDNELSTAIHVGDAVEEKISLSDRFGLSLGFHHCNQNEYLTMIRSYCEHHDIHYNDEIKQKALKWAMEKGHRSGRIAMQFIRHHQ